MPAGARARFPKSSSSTAAALAFDHLRVLRLRGRNRRFSFEWFGEYFDFQSVSDLLQSPRSGILQWQIILDSLESSPQGTLEVRMLCAAGGEGEIEVLSRTELVQAVETFFWVFAENRHLFRIRFVQELDGFERSATRGKVVEFVDRFTVELAAEVLLLFPLPCSYLLGLLQNLCGALYAVFSQRPSGLRREGPRCYTSLASWSRAASEISCQER
jgi:hypothetical protein